MPRVVGIDWATEPKNRALVALNLAADLGCGRVVELSERVERDAAVAACAAPENVVVAVDIPFGWPAEFARFVSEWRPVADAPAPPEPDRFRFRVTDRIVRKEARKLPFPVSADRIAMGARAWAELLSTHGLARRVDVRGTLCPDARQQSDRGLSRSLRSGVLDVA